MSFAQFEASPMPVPGRRATEPATALRRSLCTDSVELAAARNTANHVVSEVTQEWRLRRDVEWSCCCGCRDGGLPDNESAAEREQQARLVFTRAFEELRAEQPDAKEEALMLLEACRDTEASYTAKCEAAHLQTLPAQQLFCGSGHASPCFHPALRRTIKRIQVEWFTRHLELSSRLLVRTTAAHRRKGSTP